MRLSAMQLRHVPIAFFAFCVTVSSLVFAGPSMAEGRCPDGYFPTGGGGAGWEGCAPMGDTPDRGPGRPQPQWESRWVPRVMPAVGRLARTQNL